ncbi:hypothetical protein VPBG_00030 [Vibrio phage helene 12B3]|uniref:homing endonuclease n=1 Tax=Vibrio phage helene 12B3 TaxID=573173 RepID=UPI0002C0BA30|nr:homing endonuclease [Vibrio phage helene 12B3]AGG57802.1 hypothetical protein VPBG_00030 [Vibrio phage helene 12B3]
MDYKRIYDNLCSSRKCRGIVREAGFEVHHILPRSMGGTDKESNLVKFTPREHFFAHVLLEKITRDTPNHPQMLKALNFMINLGIYPTLKSKDYHKIRRDYLVKCSLMQRSVLGKSEFIFPLDKEYFIDKQPKFPVHSIHKRQAVKLIIDLKLRKSKELRERCIELVQFYLSLMTFGYKGVKISTNGVYARTAMLLERSGVTVKGEFGDTILSFKNDIQPPCNLFDKVFAHEFPRGFKMPFLESKINSDNLLKLIIVKRSNIDGCVELRPVNNWLKVNQEISRFFYVPLDIDSYIEALSVLKY